MTSLGRLTPWLWENEDLRYGRYLGSRETARRIPGRTASIARTASNTYVSRALTGAGDVTGHAPLADELRRVASMRTPAALRDAHLPELFRLIQAADRIDRDKRSDSLRRLLTAGIEAIPDPQFRAAADAILGFGPQRWTPLSRRGAIAGGAFGCSFDAYRRTRRSTGQSLLDETMHHVARSLAAQHTTTANTAVDEGAAGDTLAIDAETGNLHAPPTAPREPADTTPPITPSSSDPGHKAGYSPEVPPRRGRRRLRATRGLVVSCVSIALLLGAIAALVRPHIGLHPASTRSAAAAPRAPTTIERTAANTCTAIGATNDASLSLFQAPFEAAAVRSTSDSSAARCARGPLTRWGALTVQALGTSTHPDGVLVATDPTHILLLSDAQYGAYHQTGGKDGTRAQALAGLPRKIETTTSGRGLLLLTDHGAIVSEGPLQPGFFVLGPAWERWVSTGMDTGEMGLPASNAWWDSTGYLQDFEHGRLTLPWNGQLTWNKIDDPAKALPPAPEGKILRQAGGTTWWIDPATHERRWIPDGATWQCLTDRGAKQVDPVPGYAILTFPAGAPATCP